MSKLLSMSAAVFFSFLLFVVMTFLIKPDALAVEKSPKQDSISFDYVEINEQLITIKYPLPEEPKKVSPPKIIKTDQQKKPQKVAVLELREPIKVSVRSTDGIWTNVGRRARDGEAIPKVRINPRYPRIAAVKGIEGFVTLSFDISNNGSTKNINIVDASPKGIFERDAKRALKKWKYSPKMEGNVAIEQLGQEVTLEFQLETEKL
jgi:protein TonB